MTPRILVAFVPRLGIMGLLIPKGQVTPALPQRGFRAGLVGAERPDVSRLAA
jgi:hypothetical protein